VLLEADRSVVIVALSHAAFEELAGGCSARCPVHCADAFGQDALKATVSKPGGLAIAMSGALSLGLARAGDAGVDIRVFGRNPTRAADEAIERFADALGPNAHLVFHLSLEDQLLMTSGRTIGPLMEKLGMKADEPMIHPPPHAGNPQRPGENSQTGGSFGFLRSRAFMTTDSYRAPERLGAPVHLVLSGGMPGVGSLRSAPVNAIATSTETPFGAIFRAAGRRVESGGWLTFFRLRVPSSLAGAP